MTDEQKVEELAKWMGWKKFSCKTGKSEFWYWVAPAPGLVAGFHKIAGHNWNPLTNIADAWDIVGKMYALYMSDDDSPEEEIALRWSELVGPLYGYPTAREAAIAITDAALEVIE